MPAMQENVRPWSTWGMCCFDRDELGLDPEDDDDFEEEEEEEEEEE